jgi:methionyl-tRNA formyltransferase
VTRLVYLGTSSFAAAVLRGLHAGEHEIALVVTRPDAPKGRGRKLSAPPVADTARELGLELAQPQDINSDEAAQQIAHAGAGELIVCAFGAIIGEPLLSDAKPLNVHPSLLPRWRGAAPIERAMMAGDAETGVSIMQLVAELDAGPVAAQETEPILPEDTFGTLSERLEGLSVELLERVLAEAPEFTPQDEAGVTYAEKIGPADRTLDVNRPPEENARIVRALAPHIGARIELEDGSFLGVHDAAANTDGTLELVTVQPPGGHRMSYADYVRGHGRAR